MDPIHVDGSLIESKTGFKYEIPEISPDLIKQVINGFIELKVWPGEKL